MRRVARGARVAQCKAARMLDDRIGRSQGRFFPSKHNKTKNSTSPSMSNRLSPSRSMSSGCRHLTRLFRDRGTHAPLRHCRAHNFQRRQLEQLGHRRYVARNEKSHCQRNRSVIATRAGNCRAHYFTTSQLRTSEPKRENEDALSKN
jgi:hypothetical protein